MGPSYQEVAKTYAGQKDAADQLKAGIKASGSGKWGPVPMPAQPLNTKAAEARTRSFSMVFLPQRGRIGSECSQG